jgi:two-component sensor histidine kinase
MNEVYKLEIDRLRAQQRALADFGTFALRETDLHGILTEATRVCAALMDVPLCKITRYRPEHNDLIIEAGVGLPENALKNIVFHLATEPDAPAVVAFLTGQASIYSDLRVGPTYSPFYRDNKIVSTVNVIIKGSDGAYGVLQIDSPEKRDYAQHDSDFLTGFANVLAEAISTHRRLDEQKQLIEQKQMLLQELSHRVRNNLQLIHGMLDLASADAHLAQQSLAAIARRVFTLAQVYDHLLGTGMQTTIDLSGYLRALSAGITNTMTDKRITLVCGDMHPLATNLDVVTAIGLAVTELIANCQKHAFADGRSGLIVLSVRREDDVTVLRIVDDGAGMGVEPQPNKRHGLGLVRRLIQQVKGQITFASDSSGTAVTITF